MPAEKFRIDYALSLVNTFAPGGHEKGFARIERRDVVDGLRDRIADPSKQDQSAASLCGPAAFFYCVLEEHPELYTQYVIDLYKTGEARIGDLHVKPSSGCRAYQPPLDKIHPVDWIALASLRDSENSLLAAPLPTTLRPASPCRTAWQHGSIRSVGAGRATTPMWSS